VFVLSKAGVKDRVGDGVADFVRVTFTHGFGGKNVSAWHVELGLGDLNMKTFKYIDMFYAVNGFSFFVSLIKTILHPGKSRIPFI
jgi:hypothetical protein